MYGRAILIYLVMIVAVSAAFFGIDNNRARASTTVTLQPGAEGKDSYVFAMMPGNNGSATYLDAGGDMGMPPPARTYIEFDLSSIPAGATIESATLSLYYYSWFGPSDQSETISLHKVTSSWDENTITWALQPSYEAGATTSTVVGNSGAYGWYSWSITSLVSGWMGGSVANYGIALKDVTETTNTAKVFYSSDYAPASLRPKLTVTYTAQSQPPAGPDDPPVDPDDPPADPDSPPEDLTNPPADPENPPTDPQNPEQLAVVVNIPLPPAAKTVVDYAKDISKTAESKAVVAVAGTVSLVSSVAALVTLLVSELTFKEILLVLINYFLSLFAARRKEKSGVVFDQLTKQPVVGALVNLFEFEIMRLVASALTDKSGRYFFAVRKGKYALSVVKNGYIYPSQYAKGESKINQDIYFGQTINVDEEQEIINARIPIDPTAKAESKRSIFRILITSSFIRISILLLGSIVAGGVLWFVPVPLNYAICGLYLLIWLMEFYIQHREVKFSRVYDEKNRQPIDLALVRVFSSNGKLQKTYVSDFHGRFMPYIEDKDHYLMIERVGYKELKDNPEKVGFVEGKKFKLRKNKPN
jgi:hypothetical protein